MEKLGDLLRVNCRSFVTKVSLKIADESKESDAWVLNYLRPFS